MSTREKKVQQIIWLSTQDFAKIAEIAAQTGNAINTTISKLVHEIVTGEYKPIREVEKVITKVEQRYICPYCLKHFTFAKEAKCHECKEVTKNE